MLIHNTLTKKKEEFVPLHEGEVRMYLCGPTVYDFAHLGHGRSSVAFDIIRRYLIYKGYKMTFVSNYTDIDDKMIKRANEEGITVPELAARIIPHYEMDYGKLGVMPSDISPLATDYVTEMIEIVKGLEEKGFTYVLEDGVYFDVSKDSEYGKLSGQKLDELQAGARIEERTDKRNPQDFVLWKFEKPGEPVWESPWGNGRPGWHIECSAMSMKLLGETFDIHGGGLDLTFPHHECEIAQSEMFTGKLFTRVWMHNGFIQVNNEKMSKSLGNFFTLKDIFEKYDPTAVRLFLISTHYRSPINFSDEQLDQATQTLKRIKDFIFNLKTYKAPSGEDATSTNETLSTLLDQTKTTFEESMDDDFEVPGALAAIFTMMKEVNKMMAEKSISTSDAMNVLHLLRELDSVLMVFECHGEECPKAGAIDVDIESKIEARENARKEKNYELADQIRDELAAQGVELIDTPDGVKWRKN